MNQVYPSIDELIPNILRSRLPAALIDEISIRYELLGEKYLTNDKTPDGRQINSMMFTDRIQNCREEIVDGVFCIIGQIYKEAVSNNEPTNMLYDILMGLIEIYSVLKFMEHEENYTVVVSI